MNDKDKSKEEAEDRVKIYDKDMYISQEKLRTIVIIIVIFIIGFIAGYCSSSFMNTDVENTNDISNTSNKENMDR